jgi:protein-S-isoprenylcysteine O-methyltransferase Ste14
VVDAFIVAAWLIVLGDNLVLAARGIGRRLGGLRWMAGLGLAVGIVVAGVQLERMSGGRVRAPLWVTLVGVAAALAGTLLHVSARRVLGRAWSASTASPDALVDDGAYGVVRHPLYVGIALLMLGTILAHPSLPTVAAGVGLFVGLARKIRQEERALADAFGPRWDRYRARVPCVVPRLRR